MSCGRIRGGAGWCDSGGSGGCTSGGGSGRRSVRSEGGWCISWRGGWRRGMRSGSWCSSRCNTRGLCPSIAIYLNVAGTRDRNTLRFIGSCCPSSRSARTVSCEEGAGSPAQASQARDFPMNRQYRGARIVHKRPTSWARTIRSRGRAEIVCIRDHEAKGNQERKHRVQATGSASSLTKMTGW